MKDLLKQLLEEMKCKVLENLGNVKENEVDIRKLLGQPESYERAFNLQNKFGKNRNLLSDNMDYLELQLKIVNLINKYRNSDFMKTPFLYLINRDPANIDYFTETVEGRLPFNEYHPYFRDKVFLASLMAHYLENEVYEECRRLSELRSKITEK